MSKITMITAGLIASNLIVYPTVVLSQNAPSYVPGHRQPEAQAADPKKPILLKKGCRLKQYSNDILFYLKINNMMILLLQYHFGIVDFTILFYLNKQRPSSNASYIKGTIKRISFAQFVFGIYIGSFAI